jgi:hypothetical protein
MSIIVNNTDGQLNINNNGVLDVYAVRSIKSIGRAIDASSNYYIAINFISNDKNNSLRIYLKDVSSPVTWTNDLTGSNAALADLRDWLSEVIDVSIDQANDSILVYGFDGTTNRKIKTDTSGVLAIQDNGGSITVDGGTGIQRTPNFFRFSSVSPGPGTIALGTFSMSFASVGTANATVGGITLKPGETLNFDAGAINNTLGAVTYSTSTAGAELIIITLT